MLAFFHGKAPFRFRPERRLFFSDPEKSYQVQSCYTKQKKDAIEFDDSGKMAYFAVQIENAGKQGAWEPLVSIFIP
jgi:putative heme degradation protein